jgi:hypothetical protein
VGREKVFGDGPRWWGNSLATENFSMTCHFAGGRYFGWTEVLVNFLFMTFLIENSDVIHYKKIAVC